MSMQRTGARLAAVGTTTLAMTLAGAGAALAAVGPDVPAPAPVGAVVEAADTAGLPQLAPAPAASPTPSPGPVEQVVATVNGVVATVQDTLGVAPEPTPSPSRGGSATPGKGTSGSGSSAGQPAAGRGHTSTATRGSGRSSGSLSAHPVTSFGFGATAQLPHIDAVPGPQEGAVRGIGAAPYAAGQLPAAAARALGDEGVGDHSLPTLLVVVAAAACAAAAAGNVEVWRRRLADSLG